MEAALGEFDLDVDGACCVSTWALRPAALRTACCSTARGASSPLMSGIIRSTGACEPTRASKSREGVNARYLKPEDFEEKFDLAVMDVSFISATKVLPAITPLLTQDGASRYAHQAAVRGGARRSRARRHRQRPRKHARVVEEVNAAARSLGSRGARRHRIARARRGRQPRVSGALRTGLKR